MKAMIKAVRFPDRDFWTVLSTRKIQDDEWEDFAKWWDDHITEGYRTLSIRAPNKGSPHYEMYGKFLGIIKNEEDVFALKMRWE